jgi:hypothetical protein
MPEPVTTEIRKLSAIATDMALSGGLRSNAIKNMGNIGTRDALLALLELAANEKLNPGERKLALKQAERIIK